KNKGLAPKRVVEFSDELGCCVVTEFADDIGPCQPHPGDGRRSWQTRWGQRVEIAIVNAYAIDYRHAPNRCNGFGTQDN
ncbi:hypothetical protein KAH43_07765, partial [Candidatus Bipolaricaulota bacterium]|nr:hypothetical protein [Candidatus Bipolaricaulota bacterium]